MPQFVWILVISYYLSGNTNGAPDRQDDFPYLVLADCVVAGHAVDKRSIPIINGTEAIRKWYCQPYPADEAQFLPPPPTSPP